MQKKLNEMRLRNHQATTIILEPIKFLSKHKILYSLYSNEVHEYNKCCSKSYVALLIDTLSTG